MQRDKIRAGLVLLTGIVSGCGPMSDQERIKLLVPNAQKTIPIQGAVLVDGEPVKDIWVKLHPDDQAQNPTLPKAQTQADGTFKITTYTGGDGAPVGHYTITVEWLTFNPVGSRWVGPNKVDDQYGNVKTTPFEITVENQAIALPTFEVQAKAETLLEKGQKQMAKQKLPKRGGLQK